ncbi:MAG: DUF1214 domain-containing protein [Pseudomonadota bacterium]
MNTIVNVAVFLIIALTSGLGSAWLMIEHGPSGVAIAHGPWKAWSNVGRATADPYTRAHVTRSGRLPVMSKAVLYFRTLHDAEGRRVDSECDYEIIGRDAGASWWSLAAYDGAGNLMDNPVSRHAYNASTVLRAPDGSYRITLSTQPMPGNWLPVDSDYQVELVFRMFRSATSTRDEDVTRALPRVQRIGCR